MILQGQLMLMLIPIPRQESRHEITIQSGLAWKQLGNGGYLSLVPPRLCQHGAG